MYLNKLNTCKFFFCLWSYIQSNIFEHSADLSNMNWCLIFVIVYLYAKTNCSNEVGDFVCTDGTRIKLKLVCDGSKDCLDASDETENLCYHLICPPHMYRCYYGACINKEVRCDGKYQCADNSDESFCGKNAGSCETNEFQCISHECIPSEKLCNGISDCLDGSDESKITCEELLCPENTYHCKHGGCIHLDARCNGFHDCVDGSDESDVLCNSLNCFGKECDNVHNNISCPPPIFSRITIKCKSKNGWLPCDKPLPIGTVAQYECRPYYIPVNSKHANNSQSVCQPDGTWSREILKCKPECGRASPVVIPLIVNGWVAEEGMWPWHATLYNLQNGKWTFWCGGSLISEKVVLSAAHCSWKMTPDTMRAALGKYSRDYNETQEFTEIIDVKDIIIQPLYQDMLGNFGSDIAVLILQKAVHFSPFVQPVCIDWQLHDITDHLSGSMLGMVVGMGITENNTFSEKLRAVFLPAVTDDKCIEAQTRDFKKYVTYTSFCAGWKNGTGVCNGDSGGGLVFPRSGKESEWILQGIVSVSPRRLGTSFCDPKYYTIFTKVGMYVHWIQDVLNKIHPENVYDDNVADNIVLRV